MLWRIIVTLWWLGVGISLLVTFGMTAYTLLAPGIPGGERVGTVVGLWIRWILSVVGAAISLVVLAFILGLLGFDVAGFTVEPR